MTSGPLRKMRTRPETPVGYELPLGTSTLDLQSRIGGHVELRFENEILCANCGRKTKKSYSQGHCFPCSVPETVVVRSKLRGRTFSG